MRETKKDDRVFTDAAGNPRPKAQIRRGRKIFVPGATCGFPSDDSQDTSELFANLDETDGSDPRSKPPPMSDAERRKWEGYKRNIDQRNELRRARAAELDDDTANFTLTSPVANSTVLTAANTIIMAGKGDNKIVAPVNTDSIERRPPAVASTPLDTEAPVANLRNEFKRPKDKEAPKQKGNDNNSAQVVTTAIEMQIEQRNETVELAAESAAQPDQMSSPTSPKPSVSSTPKPPEPSPIAAVESPVLQAPDAAEQSRNLKPEPSIWAERSRRNLSTIGEKKTLENLENTKTIHRQSPYPERFATTLGTPNAANFTTFISAAPQYSGTGRKQPAVSRRGSMAPIADEEVQRINTRLNMDEDEEETETGIGEMEKIEEREEVEPLTEDTCSPTAAFQEQEEIPEQKTEETFSKPETPEPENRISISPETSVHSNSAVSDSILQADSVKAESENSVTQIQQSAESSVFQDENEAEPVLLASVEIVSDSSGNVSHEIGSFELEEGELEDPHVEAEPEVEDSPAIVVPKRTSVEAEPEVEDSPAIVVPKRTSVEAEPEVEDIDSPAIVVPKRKKRVVFDDSSADEMPEDQFSPEAHCSKGPTPPKKPRVTFSESKLNRSASAPPDLPEDEEEAMDSDASLGSGLGSRPQSVLEMSMSEVGRANLRRKSTYVSDRPVRMARKSVLTSVDSADDDEQELPKHVTLEGDKPRRRSMHLLNPKLVTPHTPTTPGVRRSKRTRLPKLLHHLGQEAKYSPGGSLRGVKDTVMRDPIYTNKATTDLAKNLEDETRLRKLRAKVNRTKPGHQRRRMIREHHKRGEDLDKDSESD